jgi:hypothetical protein
MDYQKFQINTTGSGGFRVYKYRSYTEYTPNLGLLTGYKENVLIQNWLEL